MIFFPLLYKIIFCVHGRTPDATDSGQQTKDMEKKRKLFDIVLSVSENGERITTDLTCTKDGQNMMPEALTGTNVSYALEALRYATGLFARLYVVQLHRDGKITDEQYQECREETRA